MGTARAVRRTRELPARLSRWLGGDRAFALGVAVAVCAAAFVAKGGVALAPITWTYVAAILAGGGVVAAALAAPGRFVAVSRPWGIGVVVAFAALTGLTAASITWSLAPDRSWLDANRMIAYLAVLAGGVGLVRLAPHRWNAVLAGLATASVAICSWALVTKTFPGLLADTSQYARLRAPFDYWNAVGLAAALGVPPLLWLGARRSGHAAVNALAYPGLGLVLVCLMLSYSRGALVAVAVGLALWLAFVPLRLRSVLVAGVSGVVAAGVVAWAFAQPGLSEDGIAPAARADAGHELGVLLMLMTVVLLGAGLALAFLSTYRPPSARTRRRAGYATAAVAAVAALGAVGAFVLSGGGLGQRLSELTDPQTAAPGNSPDRLTATSSVRSQYWREAFEIHAEVPWLGAGAEAYAIARYRHRRSQLDVAHAHGYVPQTLADLGRVGMLLSLVAVGAWLWAASAAIGLRRRDRGLPWDAERIGLFALAVVVVVFGVHSTLDWTWYVPALAMAALLAAGWVAGRGPLRRRLEREGSAPAGAPRPHGGLPLTARLRSWRPHPYRSALAAAVLITAMAAAWTAVQPLRSEMAGDAAAARLAAGDIPGAVDRAQVAVDRNPLAVEPLFELAAIQTAAGRPEAAHAALEEAVALQPANREAWRRLGYFRLRELEDPQAALEALRAAYFLDPQNPEAVSDVLTVNRALQETP